MSEKSSVEEAEEAIEYACAPVKLSCRSGEVCGVSAEQMAMQVYYAEIYWCGN